MRIDISALIPKLEYEIIATELRDYPILLSRADGVAPAIFTGTIYRICTEKYCFTTMFPSKEAAEWFVNKPVYFTLGGN